MKTQRPKTAEEYVKLVDEAIIEVEELVACFEYEMDDAGERTRHLDPLIASLKALRQSMADGSYQFENKDLPFMEMSSRMVAQLPFSQLLAVINETHRYGLDTSAD